MFTLLSFVYICSQYWISGKAHFLNAPLLIPAFLKTRAGADIDLYFVTKGNVPNSEKSLISDSWKRSGTSKLRLIYEYLSPKHACIVAMKAQHSHCRAVCLEEGMLGVQALLSNRGDKRVELPSCAHIT